MKKKTIILTIIISIVAILLLKLIIDYKKNEQIKDKYENYNITDNLLSGINLDEDTYKIADKSDLDLSQEYINSEIFHKYSKDIKISNKDLKYYGYCIDKEENQYIYAPIISNYDVLSYKVPLQKYEYEFIKQNLLNKEDLRYIEIFPFEDKKHLFIELHYNIRKYKNLFAFVNLSNKTIKYLDNPYFYTARINLKENIVIVRSDTRPSYYHVFNENGDFITKYE